MTGKDDGILRFAQNDSRKQPVILRGGTIMT